MIARLKTLGNRYPRLATVGRCILDQIAMTEPPTRTPWGFLLRGNHLMTAGKFEPEETILARELLMNVEVLVNVGANIGYYCCHALSLDKHVIAFEPMPRNIQYLLMNLKANGWSSAEIFEMALADRPGIAKIYGGGTGASLVKGWANITEEYVSLVPCNTMDTVLGERLRGKKTLILIDVEGSEEQVLKGGERVLRNTPRPILMVEILVKEHQPRGVFVNPHLRDTFQRMFRLGYKAECATPERQPVTMADVEAASRGERSFASHNILFS